MRTVFFINAPIRNNMLWVNIVTLDTCNRQTDECEVHECEKNKYECNVVTSDSRNSQKSLEGGNWGVDGVGGEEGDAVFSDGIILTTPCWNKMEAKGTPSTKCAELFMIDANFDMLLVPVTVYSVSCNRAGHYFCCTVLQLDYLSSPLCSDGLPATQHFVF